MKPIPEAGLWLLLIPIFIATLIMAIQSIPRNKRKSIGELIGLLVCTVILGSLSFYSVTSVMAEQNAVAEEIYTVEVNDKNLASADDGNYLFATNSHYRFFYEVAEGVRQEEIRAEKASISFTSDTPVFRKTTTTTGNTYNWWIYHWEESSTTVKEEILIPEGSIKTQFTQ